MNINLLTKSVVRIVVIIFLLIGYYQIAGSGLGSGTDFLLIIKDIFLLVHTLFLMHIMY